MSTLNNKILIAGGSGFIGKYFLNSILHSNFYEIHIIHRSKSDLNFLKSHKKFHLYNIDDIGCNDIINIVKPHIAINFVCSYSKEMYFSNFEFGKLFVDSCIKHRVGYFINTHTLLKSDKSEYLKTKLLFVEYLKKEQNNINIINISPELVYGNHYHENKLINYLATELKNKKEIHIMNSNQKRDFIHISDLINAYTSVISNINKFKRFSQIDVATGNLTTVKNFVNLFIEVFFKLNNSRVIFNNNSTYILKYNLDTLKSFDWNYKISLNEGLSIMYNNLKNQ